VESTRARGRELLDLLLERVEIVGRLDLDRELFVTTARMWLRL
jgi:hypothetical protein